MQEAGMSKCDLLIPTLLAAAIVVPLAKSAEAANVSPYLLQDHGTVRVMRGLKPGKNFETAKLPKETEVVPAAGPEPETQANSSAAQTQPKSTSAQLQPMGTKEKVLQ
jgi:hypothetical protein